MKVLVACEFSGVVRDAFIERGHDAWSCGLLPSKRNPDGYNLKSVTFEGVVKAMAEQWG